MYTVYKYVSLKSQFIWIFAVWTNVYAAKGCEAMAFI